MNGLAQAEREAARRAKAGTPMPVPVLPDPTVLTPTITGRGQRAMYVPLKNTPGVLMAIDKRLLHIDPRYQRKLNDRQVARYVGNWSWVSCGVLTVSQRPGAHDYFVIDGQHRLKAAGFLSNVTDLPCIKFELDTVKDEAIGFLAANVERRMPTISDQFRALIIAGDPIALAMDEMASAYSRVWGVPSDHNHISCTTAFAKMMRENAAAMKRVFPVVAELAAGHQMTARLIWGFHRLERCMPKGESLSDLRWRSRVKHVGYVPIVESIRQTLILDSKGGPRACAMGVMRAINHGLRSPLVANVDVVRR